MTGTVSLPLPVTPEGRAGLAALLGDPARALVALDFDGTLSPIVADPAEARAHPDAVPALRRVAASIGTLAVITGRPAASAVDLGGFAAVPDLIVLGHYGLERWADGTLSSPPSAAVSSCIRLAVFLTLPLPLVLSAGRTSPRSPRS